MCGVLSYIRIISKTCPNLYTHHPNYHFASKTTPFTYTHPEIPIAIFLHILANCYCIPVFADILIHVPTQLHPNPLQIHIRRFLIPPNVHNTPDYDMSIFFNPIKYTHIYHTPCFIPV